MGGRLCAIEDMEREQKALDGRIREMIGEVSEAMRTLEVNCYLFCQHYFIAALEIDEVCRVMDRSEKTVKKYAARARTYLSGLS